jgi:hypothetical protein
MYTRPEVIVIFIFALLDLGIISGIRHIVKLRRGPVLVIKSNPIQTTTQATSARDAAWDLFDDIQDQIPVLPKGEKHSETIIANYDPNVSDSVLVAALRLLKDAGWNATLSGPGRMQFVADKDRK